MSVEQNFNTIVTKINAVSDVAYLNYPEWQPQTEYKTGDLIKIKLGNNTYARVECLKDFTSGSNVGNVPWSADMEAGNIVMLARCGIIEGPVEYDKMTGISPDVWSVKNYLNNAYVKMGDLKNLTTTEKETLVDAINEVQSIASSIDLSGYATVTQLNAEKTRITNLESSINGVESRIRDITSKI